MERNVLTTDPIGIDIRLRTISKQKRVNIYIYIICKYNSGDKLRKGLDEEMPTVERTKANLLRSI